MKTPMDKYLSHPVAIAVEPLRADAIASAEKFARAKVKSVTEQLAAVNNDIDAVAPYPSSFHTGRNEYHEKLAKYRLFSSLTKWRDSVCTSSQGPNFVDVVPKYVEKFVENSKEAASAQYDVFIAKLANKIGPTCIFATLSGNHIWGWSFLDVTLVSGEKQIWKTMQIANVSKHGKYFPQWPSRKVKEKIPDGD